MMKFECQGLAKNYGISQLYSMILSFSKAFITAALNRFWLYEEGRCN